MYHRMKNTFGNNDEAASKSSQPPSAASFKHKSPSLLQRDWGRQKGATHA